jgi:hypothetical protein
MSNPDDIAEMIDLLPFFVTGTLSTADSARIETALPKIPQLREELAATSGLFALVKEQGGALIAGSGMSESRLKSLIGRIGTEKTAERRERKPLRTASGSGIWQRIATWRWAPALAMLLAAIVTVQAGMIMTMTGAKDTSGYVAASGPDDDAKNSGQFLVRLVPEARWTDVAALLDREDLKIFEGPNDGVLTVGTSKKRTAADVDALRKRLRGSRVIAFVGDVR